MTIINDSLAFCQQELALGHIDIHGNPAQSGAGSQTLLERYLEHSGSQPIPSIQKSPPGAPDSAADPPMGAKGVLPPDSLLDTREQLDSAAKIKKRLNAKASLKRQSIHAIEQIAMDKELLGRELTDYHENAEYIITKWWYRMIYCSTEAFLYKCKNDGRVKVRMDCCRVPLCPHEEQRAAGKWSKRVEKAMKTLPSSITWGRIKTRLAKLNIQPPKIKEENKSLFTWKMITVSIKGKKNLLDDVENNKTLRTKFARYLKLSHKMIAGYVVIEVSSGGHVHMHSLIYSPYIERDSLIRWLKAQTCSIPGCKHLAEDRSCEGDFSIDIRKAYSPAEVMKYACSIDAKGMAPREFAKFRIAVYLCFYKQKRVATYGLALPKYKLGEEVEEKFDKDCCPECGDKMSIVEYGYLKRSYYIWSNKPRE